MTLSRQSVGKTSTGQLLWLIQRHPHAVADGKQLGMPIHVREGQLAVYSRTGSKISNGHAPCEYLPVMMSGDAIMVQSSFVH